MKTLVVLMKHEPNSYITHLANASKRGDRTFRNRGSPLTFDTLEHKSKSFSTTSQKASEYLTRFARTM